MRGLLSRQMLDCSIELPPGLLAQPLHGCIICKMGGPFDESEGLTGYSPEDLLLALLLGS